MKRCIALMTVLCLALAGAAWAQGPRSTTTVFSVQNEAVTGTVTFMLAKLAAGRVIQATTTDTDTDLYLVVAGGGTTGEAMLLLAGAGSCVFDATNASGVSGQFVTASTSTAGRCHVSASPPASGIVIGKLVDDATVNGELARLVVLNQPYVPGSPGAGSGTVNSGTARRLAHYPVGGDGTTVDDLAAVPTSGRALKGDGTDWVTSSVGMAGAGACTNEFVRATNTDAVPTCDPVTSADTDTSIAATGVDINTSHQVTGASVAFALKGDVSPTALAGDINDYNPTDLATATVLRIDGGAANRNWSGLAGGADGRVIFACNIGTTNLLTLVDQSASSTAANRFALNGNVTLQPSACTTLLYDSTTQRWRGQVSAVPDALAVRSCQLVLGDTATTSTALAADNDTPDVCGNDYGRAWKITSFACKADGGSPTVTPILTGGSATSIVTGAVTCGTSWTAGTLNGTPTLNSFSADGVTCSSTPCTLAANITTTSTTKMLHFKFTGSLQR